MQNPPAGRDNDHLWKEQINRKQETQHQSFPESHLPKKLAYKYFLLKSKFRKEKKILRATGRVPCPGPGPAQDLNSARRPPGSCLVQERIQGWVWVRRKESFIQVERKREARTLPLYKKRQFMPMWRQANSWVTNMARQFLGFQFPVLLTWPILEMWWCLSSLAPCNCGVSVHGHDGIRSCGVALWSVFPPSWTDLDSGSSS